MLTLALALVQFSFAASTSSSATVQNQPQIPSQTGKPGNPNQVQLLPGQAPVMATPQDSEGPRASGAVRVPKANPDVPSTQRSLPTQHPLPTATPIP